MTVLQFLGSLPALLGFTGFVIYYFIQRNQGGDQVTLTIVGKLRAAAADRLPPEAERFDAGTLAKFIEGDNLLRSKISEQDFQLLRDALRQQFITSLVVYGACGVIFVAGILFYVYLNPPAKPVTLNDFGVESVNPLAKGIPVDLDELQVRWAATGDPEDLQISLQEMEKNRQTPSKTVRSTNGQVNFSVDDYKSILLPQKRNGQNRLRVVARSQEQTFYSPEFFIRAGITIAAFRFAEKQEIRIAALINNAVIDSYDFEAKLIVWGKRKPGNRVDIFPFGGKINNGQRAFPIDPGVDYDWPGATVGYLGPDDIRLVRTERVGF